MQTAFTQPDGRYGIAIFGDTAEERQRIIGGNDLSTYQVDIAEWSDEGRPAIALVITAGGLIGADCSNAECGQGLYCASNLDDAAAPVCMPQQGRVVARARLFFGDDNSIDPDSWACVETRATATLGAQASGGPNARDLARFSTRHNKTHMNEFDLTPSPTYAVAVGRVMPSNSAPSVSQMRRTPATVRKDLQRWRTGNKWWRLRTTVAKHDRPLPSPRLNEHPPRPSTFSASHAPPQ